MNLSLLRLGALAGCLVLASSAVGENWPQWRGPDNDGISHETGLPTHWSAAESIAWKLALPSPSGATPAIWGKRIFVPSEDHNDIVLLCIGTDGKLCWKRKFGEGAHTFNYGEGNNASPSPSTDGKHVWVFAGTGDFACFDFDGNEVWHFNAQKRYGRFSTYWGMHTSPVLYGDQLYLQLLHANANIVVALDKANGKEIWKVERQSDAKVECRHSYASPSVWHKGQDAYLVTHGADYAIAMRLADGKEIWRVGGLNPVEHYRNDLRFVASPVVTPDLIVVPSAKQHPVVGVRPDAHGVTELWRKPHDTPDVPSPLVVNGLVYLCTENGTLICLDGQSGEEHYRKRLHAAKYRASPVYADGHVYLTARDGTITVVKAGPTYQEVAVNRLPDDLAASPVISNGRIYLRGFKALYAIGTTVTGRK